MQKITVRSVVVSGKKRGRSLGFPTANMVLESPIDSGVYAGQVIIDGQEKISAIYVDASNLLLEAHVLDFEGDLYGKEWEVRLTEKVRESMIFESSEMLVEQIGRDIVRIREIFKVK